MKVILVPSDSSLEKHENKDSDSDNVNLRSEMISPRPSQKEIKQ